MTSTPRCAPTRWEPCSRCRGIKPGSELLHVSAVHPHRKRGWLCRDCVAVLVASGVVQAPVQLTLLGD